MLTHATLYQVDSTDYRILTPNEQRIDVPACTVVDLFRTMEQAHIDALWVMPDTDLHKAISTSDFDQLDARKWKVFYPQREKHVSFARIRRNEPRAFNRFLAFPGNREWKAPDSDDKGRWYLPSPYYLNTTLDYIEKEAGISVAWSPGHMGIELLRDIHLEQREHIEPLSHELRAEWDVIVAHSMDRPTWRKLARSGAPGLSESDKQKKLIVGLDKNAQYIGASASSILGYGDYRHVASTSYHEKAIGFWKYRLCDVSNTVFNGYDLYCPLDVNRQWASTELIRAARYVGVELDIVEGVVWETGRPYMKQWAHKIFQSRVNLRNIEAYPSEIARENAEGTFKVMANSMVGRLNNESAKFAQYAHPDWNLSIIHQAIASQCFTLNALAKKGIMPVLVCKDAFYILCDDYELLQASFADKLDRNKLNGFKVVGVTELTPTIIDAFSDKSLSANKLEAIIKERM